VDTLHPSERKILISIAQKEKITFYELHKKENIASKATIIKALNRLTSIGCLSTNRETKGRKRVYYSITEKGLFTAMATNEFWSEPEILDKVAKQQIEMLPLLFGKLAHFKKNEYIYKKILYSLRYSSRNILSKLKYHNLKLLNITQNIMEQRDPSYFSEEEQLNTIIFFLKELTDFSKPEMIAQEMLYYPDDDNKCATENLSNLHSTICIAALDTILGFDQILSIQIYLIPFFMGVLLTAIEDEDLSNYITDFFERKEKELKLNLERVDWWLGVLKKAKNFVNSSSQ
jgi:DNA-binding PadR family transcriptional regulator